MPKKKPREGYQEFMADGRTPRCQAMSKQKKQQCGQPARLGHHVCKFHGAGTAQSPGGRPPKTLRYGDKIPRYLSSRIAQFLDDPEILDQYTSIAVIDARVQQRLEGLGDEGISLGHLKDAIAVLSESRSNIKAGLKDADFALIEKGIKAFDNGLDLAELALEVESRESGIWYETRELLQERKAIAESQRRHVLEQKENVSPLQFLQVLSVFRDFIQTELGDNPDAIRRAADIFRQLFSQTRQLEAVGKVNV